LSVEIWLNPFSLERFYTETYGVSADIGTIVCHNS
jgi:hypothetical protein